MITSRGMHGKSVKQLDASTCIYYYLDDGLKVDATWNIRA